MLKWIKVTDKDASIIEEATNEELQLTYEILPAQQRTDEKWNGYMVNRCSLDYKFEDGILGEYKGEVGICCGISIFCAIGLPPNTGNGNLDYVKELAERDLNNLKNGKNYVFVDKFTKKENG